MPLIQPADELNEGGYETRKDEEVDVSKSVAQPKWMLRFDPDPRCENLRCLMKKRVAWLRSMSFV
jgi:hypothetical protein